MSISQVKTLVENYSKVCRFCLNMNAANLAPLFDRIAGKMDIITINATIRGVLTTLGIQIAQNDPYPNRICDSCRDLLHSIQHFQETVKKSVQLLDQARLLKEFPNAKFDDDPVAMVVKEDYEIEEPVLEVAYEELVESQQEEPEVVEDVKPSSPEQPESPPQSENADAKTEPEYTDMEWVVLDEGEAESHQEEVYVDEEYIVEEEEQISVVSEATPTRQETPEEEISAEVVSRITENGSAVSFRPNDEQIINVAFYPKRKLYNTTETIIREHFNDIQNCGIGVVTLVWHPTFHEGLLRAIFKTAAIHNLKIAIEILEYPERTIESIRNNIKYFIDLFGKDQDSSTLSYFKVLSKQRDLPIFYIRKAYQIADTEWMRLLSRNGILTIRGTSYDAIVLAHISTKEHKSVVRRGGFDGFYTYLPSNGANYVSTWKNWSQLKKFADSYHLMFVPTIGPGYYDRKKYSRNANQNHGISNIKRYRSNGQYFDVAWRTALKNNAQIITINSYNNWVDGTQIEAAIPVFGFRDYLPGPPEKYLDLTQAWIEEYVKYKLNSIKLGKKIEGALGCYDFINNTIC